MKKNNENTNAFLIHISAFAGFIFPFGHIITPLIAWQTLKERSPFLDEQGKVTMLWTLNNAWPTKITSTDLKSDGNEVAVDTIEIAHEQLIIKNS